MIKADRARLSSAKTAARQIVKQEEARAKSMKKVASPTKKVTKKK